MKQDLVSCSIVLCDYDLLLWTKFLLKCEKIHELKPSKIRQMRNLTVKIEILGAQRFKSKNDDIKRYKTLYRFYIITGEIQNTVTRPCPGSTCTTEHPRLTLVHLKCNCLARHQTFTGCLNREVSMYINTEPIACWP